MGLEHDLALTIALLLGVFFLACIILAPLLIVVTNFSAFVVSKFFKP